MMRKAQRKEQAKQGATLGEPSALVKHWIDGGKPRCLGCGRVHSPPCYTADLRKWLEAGRPRCRRCLLRHALECEFAG